MPQGNPMGYMAPAEAQRQEALSRQAPPQDLTAMIAQMLQMSGGPNPNAPVTPAESQRQAAMGGGQEPQPLSPEEIAMVMQQGEAMPSDAAMPQGGTVDAQVMEDDAGSANHIPASDEQAIADAADTGDGTSQAGGTYTVKQGDNLWNIAKRFLGDPQLYQQIAQMNGIDDPNMIQPGMQIQLPPSNNTPDRNPNAA